MTKEEREIIFLLAQKLTGAHPEGTFQHSIFIANVERRMRERQIDSVSDYLKFAREDAEENGHLISALSIHTTSWFRENPHYVILQKIILRFLKENRPFRVWSGACSTGEEVYSLALLFEEFREHHPAFDYAIMGTDIDPVSVNFARRAIYDKKDLHGPIEFYKKHVLLGTGPTENHFTFTKTLRDHCRFSAHDIREPMREKEPFDLIICRNVLIYFPAAQVERVVRGLIAQLRPGGHLILGHSELIDYNKLGLSLRGNAVYGKKDSAAVVREQKAKQKAAEAATQPVPPAKVIRKLPKEFKCDLILIGASTGGPQALTNVLSKVEGPCPPIVIVQHISPNFSRAFAANICETSGLTLGAPFDRTKLEPNHMYMADGDYHLGVEKANGSYVLRHFKRPAVNGHRPSVDFLFSSIAESAQNVAAILLSGMGHDGAKGMEQLHNNGAYTIAQTESDCVVYGMPKEAVDLNAVDFIGTGSQIHEKIRKMLSQQV